MAVGLGFRRDLANATLALDENGPDFLEIAPENWMGMGGYWRHILNKAAEQYPITCHGLSLSIGSADPLNLDFVKRLKTFLDDYEIELYSEHLSYSQSKNAHLYDLLPIPFRKDAVNHISERIQRVQDVLKRPLILENVSYYTPVGAELTEAEFIRSIVEQSGCKLLLDINNVYVNAFNHAYEPRPFIAQLPLSEVAYIHMAGHEQVAEDLIIDTHGQPIIDPVYELFEWTAKQLQPLPVLLERDFNFPKIDALLDEMNTIRSLAPPHWETKRKVHAQP